MPKELGISPEFKDHFSERSDRYAKYRPTYPDDLFQFLASVAGDHDAAWDCATGNGQVALALADHFTNVTATDASQAQIDAAIRHPKVSYRTASAEKSGLDENAFDMLTVGQAFHWFDEQRFIAEAVRTLRCDGVLAIWSYELSTVNPECDAIVQRLYEDIVGEFWPPERVVVEQGYCNVTLPGSDIQAPAFHMSHEWRVEDMLGFVRTWSACRRYAATRKTDPVAIIATDLTQAWGKGRRTIRWPLNLKVSRPNSPARMGE